MLYGCTPYCERLRASTAHNTAVPFAMQSSATSKLHWDGWKSNPAPSTLGSSFTYMEPACQPPETTPRQEGWLMWELLLSRSRYILLVAASSIFLEAGLFFIESHVSCHWEQKVTKRGLDKRVCQHHLILLKPPRRQIIGTETDITQKQTHLTSPGTSHSYE